MSSAGADPGFAKRGHGERGSLGQRGTEPLVGELGAKPHEAESFSSIFIQKGAKKIKYLNKRKSLFLVHGGGQYLDPPVDSSDGTTATFETGVLRLQTRNSEMRPS